jgi:hypothetical protein
MERSGNGTGATSPPGHHGPFCKNIFIFFQNERWCFSR